MAGCAFMLSILFFVIGLIVLFLPVSGSVEMANRVPLPDFRLAPSPISLRSNQPAPTAVQGGANMQPVLQKLAWLNVGQQIRVPHPVKGELTVHVLGRILYTELWQQSRGPQNPWVPTGNQFAGFWLNGEMLLLNWQSRFYLLDENQTLSDADIQRDFAPYARTFAQSDQTANVNFAYPPASWHIDDIGKFRVEAVDGSVLPVQVGAIGRFIHASGDSGRALVVEDYEGGAQDTVWIGYLIKEEQIQKV